MSNHTKTPTDSKKLITRNPVTQDLRVLRSQAIAAGDDDLADWLGYEIDMREDALGHLESVDFSGWGF